MTGTYDKQVAMVKRVIEKYGQVVEWHILANDASSNPFKPWDAEAEEAAVKPVFIAFIPDTREGRETFRAITGEVPAGQVIGLMSAVDFEPNLKDVVMRDGKQMSINYIDVLSPNGQIIMYTIGFDK